MSDNNTEERQPGPLNPQSLRLADMARVLSASSRIDEIERERLTEYKLHHVHCARCCVGEDIKW